MDDRQDPGEREPETMAELLAWSEREQVGLRPERDGRWHELAAQRDRLILSEKAAGFGLFVDVGVAEGLVHRSEITWDKAVNPTAVHLGAFARLADGLEGLVHISELAEHRVAQPADVVAVGDRVRVRAVAIDESGGGCRSPSGRRARPEPEVRCRGAGVSSEQDGFAVGEGA